VIFERGKVCQRFDVGGGDEVEDWSLVAEAREEISELIIS
jgi:hypothetical protein